jgi:hypothetical protein
LAVLVGIALELDGIGLLFGHIGKFQHEAFENVRKTFCAAPVAKSVLRGAGMAPERTSAIESP